MITDSTDMIAVHEEENQAENVRFAREEIETRRVINHPHLVN